MFERAASLVIAASLVSFLVGCSGHGGGALGGDAEGGDAEGGAAEPEDAAVGDVVDAGQTGTAVDAEAGEDDVIDAASDAVASGETSVPDGFSPETDAAQDASTTCSPFVTGVVKVEYGPGAGFGQTALPGVVQGPPKGGGCCRGSLHVLSLGEGGSIVLEFGKIIVDEPGPDFIVFENPFNVGGNPNNPYAEPAKVEVSADGVAWFGFPCTASGFPWGNCAGWHPVFANPDGNAIDPLDPAASGGDLFDLADLALDGGPTEVKYVRIVDRADVDGDFDLDAIGVVHGRCR